MLSVVVCDAIQSLCDPGPTTTTTTNITKGRMVYVYAPNVDVPSILKNGYLSVRALYEKTGFVDVVKYKQQCADACVKYADLRELVALISDEKERVLAYLDWRDETTLCGASAIYFLYAPIPINESGVSEHIRLYRGDFLRDRTLLQLRLSPSDHIVSIPLKNPPTPKQIDSQRFWSRLWQQAVRVPVECALWFDGIPHGYSVCGHIPPNNIFVMG